MEVNTDDDEEEDFFNITSTKGSQMITPRSRHRDQSFTFLMEDLCGDINKEMFH